MFHLRKRESMSNLGQYLITTDASYSASAWAAVIRDTSEQRSQLRSGPGLVLQQEGLIRDLISAGNRQVRRNLGFAVSDRVKVRLLVSPEMWWALHYNLDLFVQDLLVEEIEINQQSVAEAIDAGWEELVVGDKKSATFTVYMTAELSTSNHLSHLAAVGNLF